MQTPSVGRIVHYLVGDDDGDIIKYAAIVTRVWSDSCINIAYFLPGGGTGSAQSVCLCTVTDGSPGTWCWPERV